MAANFNLAKSIFLNGEELVTLLAELKPSKFAFTILNCLVAEDKTGKVGAVTGFSSLKANNNNNNDPATKLVQTYLSNQNNEQTAATAVLVAEADLALVVDFGDVKQPLRLSSLQQRGTLSQHEHGLFIQRCSVRVNTTAAASGAGGGGSSSSSSNNDSISSFNQIVPEAERLIEIRSRLAHGRESNSSSFATWKILNGDALKNFISNNNNNKLSGTRRNREEEENEGNDNTTTANNTTTHTANNIQQQQQQQTINQFQDHRVARLQGQLSEQLSALSQARNEVRSLQNEVQILQNQLRNNNNNVNNQQSSQQQSSSSSISSSSSSEQQQKLLTIVSSLTTKVSKLNSQIDELVCAGAAKFNVEPTVEAVLEAMQKM